MWDKPGWFNWLWQFLSEGLSSINLKGFYYSYAWYWSLCEGRTSFPTGLTSKKLYRFLLMYQSTSLSLCTFFYSTLSNIDEVLSIMINLVNSILIFLSQTTLLRWFPYCNSHSPALSDLSLSFDAIICSTMVFLPLRNSDHVVVSDSIDRKSNSQQDAPFHCIAYNYSCND